MNIHTVNFKGVTRFGYDDKSSSIKRKLIREDINRNIFASNDVFIKNNRLEEYELNKLINSLAKKGNAQKARKGNIDHQKLGNLVYNVRPITGTSNYSGSTYCISDEGFCKELKEAGVDKIVFLRHDVYSPTALEKSGIEASCYFINNEIWEEVAFQSKRDAIQKAKDFFKHYDVIPYTEDEIIDIWNQEKRPFIDEFTDFIKDMQGDNILVGCPFGVDRTMEFLMLNYFFNPKAHKPEQWGKIRDKNKFAIMTKKLYENLEPKDKEKMGWDEEFDKNFIPRLEKWTSGAKNLT